MKTLKSRIFLVVISILFLNGVVNAQEAKSRDEISDKYKWNINHIYPSWEAWENDLNKVDEMYQELASYQGKLGFNSETYLAFSKLEDEMSKIGEKLGNFVFLYRSLDGDMTNSDTYMAVVTQLTSLVDQLEKELKAQGRI